MNPSHLKIGHVFQKSPWHRRIPQSIELWHEKNVSFIRKFHDHEVFTVLSKKPHHIHQLELGVLCEQSETFQTWILSDHSEFWLDFDFLFCVL
jgi:hypothetical protein